MEAYNLKISDEILADMLKNVTWGEISRKYRSKSQLYEAFGFFQSEMKEKYQKLLDDVNQIQKKVDKCKGELDEKQKETRKVSLEVDRLRNEKSVLVKETEELNEKLCWLKISVAELESRGYNEKIVKSVEVIEKRSGKSLLSQIRTVDEYNNIALELSKLRKEKKALEKKITSLEEKKSWFEEEINQLNISYDEMRVRSLSYDKMLEVTEDFFEKGYDAKLMKSLRDGLRLVRGKDNPTVAINRFVDRARKAKTLYELESAIKKKTQKLHQVDLDIREKEDIVSEIDSRVKMVGDLVKNGLIEIANEGIKMAQEQNEVYNKFLQENKEGINNLILELKTAFFINIELNRENARLEEKIKKKGFIDLI